jgi:3-oxoacyl-(acyl-carrier-protein) synthase
LIAGGVDGLYETFFKAHDVFEVMSAEDTFSNRLAPFDRDRAGFVLGEGAYGFWLRRTGDGDRPSCGEILGVGAASAAVPLNGWPTRVEPLVRTMRLALEDAGLTPDDVDVVYASANGTRELDAVEARALSSLFGGRRTVVTAIKGALGEFGASGAASCAAALLCGADARVPPIAGLAEPDESTAGVRLARTAMTAPGPVALVNSFASGGTLFSLVLRTSAPTST